MILKLGELAEVASGLTFRSRVEVSRGGAVRVIQMKDLGDDHFVHLEGSIRIDCPQPKPNRLAKSGDLIFRSRGQTHTAALLREQADNAVVAAPLFRVRPDAERVLPEFLLWWINRPSSQSYLASRTEGTAVKMIGKRDLENLAVNLPSLKRQRKIADFFGLSTRERRILEGIQRRKAILAQGILTRMVNQEKWRKQ